MYKAPSDEFCAEILLASVKAINYWCEVVSATDTADNSYSRLEILETAEDPPKHHTVTLDTVRKGIDKMMKDLPGDDDKARVNPAPNFWQLRAWLEMSLQDGDTIMIDDFVADAIVQLGLFGEAVYG
jgi:hypothetical protein